MTKDDVITTSSHVCNHAGSQSFLSHLYLLSSAPRLYRQPAHSQQAKQREIFEFIEGSYYRESWRDVEAIIFIYCIYNYFIYCWWLINERFETQWQSEEDTLAAVERFKTAENPFCSATHTYIQRKMQFACANQDIETYVLSLFGRSRKMTMSKKDKANE